MPKHKRKGHEKRYSLTKILGLAGGEYYTLTDGGSTSLMDTLQSSGENVVRQQIIGLTGYDLQTNKFTPMEAVRFWGPTLAGWLVAEIGRRLVGPVKLSRHFKLF